MGLHLSSKSLALCSSLLLLSGCAALTAATGSLLGRGVNANVQAGAENRQAVVSTEGQDLSPKLSFGLGSTVSGVTQTTEQSQTRAETIQTYNANPPLWVWLLLVVGWMLPSPAEMARQIVGIFRRK